jgi:hypothetical protein
MERSRHSSDPDHHWEYDLAVSYAGEDRPVADEIARKLKRMGYKLFYDGFERAKLIGEDLTSILGEIYANGSRYCLILISKEYVTKPWTNHERQFALSRALKERRAYILPLKLDDTDLPGLSPTIGYLDLRNSTVPELCSLLAQKLGPPAGERSHSVDETRVSKARIRDVLSACYRRAVFTRLHAQMSHDAMIASLADCRVALQRLVVRVTPSECQRLVAGIIGELDLIERVHAAGFTWAGSGTAATIDGAKLRIIHSLSELARVAKLPLEFPQSLTEELMRSKEDADSAPKGHETWEGWIGRCGGFKG